MWGMVCHWWGLLVSKGLQRSLYCCVVSQLFRISTQERGASTSLCGRLGPINGKTMACTWNAGTNCRVFATYFEFNRLCFFYITMFFSGKQSSKPSILPFWGMHWIASTWRWSPVAGTCGLAAASLGKRGGKLSPKDRTAGKRYVCLWYEVLAGASLTHSFVPKVRKPTHVWINNVYYNLPWRHNLMFWLGRPKIHAPWNKISTIFHMWLWNHSAVALRCFSINYVTPRDAATKWQ